MIPESPQLSGAIAPADAAGVALRVRGRLAKSVRGRLKRPQTGSSPAELRLGHDCSVERCVSLLSYLDWRWNQPPREPPADAVSALDLCSGGLGGAYYRVGGRTFDRRGPLRPFGAQNAQHLASLDALTDFDRGKEQAERSWAWERWEGTCESREASLVGKGSAHCRWHLEQLVIVRDEERIRAGYVTRIALDRDDRPAITIRLWSGTPNALTLRPLSSPRSEAPRMPALLLSETPDDKACLILAARRFTDRKSNPTTRVRSGVSPVEATGLTGRRGGLRSPWWRTCPCASHPEGVAVPAPRSRRPAARASPASRRDERRRSWLPGDALVELEGRGGGG